MRRIKPLAAHIGLGIAAVYAFFSIPEIKELFPAPIMLAIRQALSIGFAFCLIVNPKGLLQVGESFVPKIIQFLQLFQTKKKDD